MYNARPQTTCHSPPRRTPGRLPLVNSTAILFSCQGVEMLLVYCVVLLAVLAANVVAILVAATVARHRMHHD